MNNKLTKLSKKISYALRHAPTEYGLELDQEGWVLTKDLIFALKNDSDDEYLNEEILSEINKGSSKKRFKIKHGKIRALYGHSTPNKISKALTEPPKFLFHGTTLENANIILTEGLKPMKRQHVHLSIDVKTAKIVGIRKTPNPTLSKIHAKEAYKHQVYFYMGNENTWLADFIPPKYIEKIS